ncbi:MAG: hypothetical protein ACLRWQ_21345 [Flavonifractor plautii]
MSRRVDDSRAALAGAPQSIIEAYAAYERLLGDAETVFLKLEDCALSGRDADSREGVPHRPGRRAGQTTRPTADG